MRPASSVSDRGVLNPRAGALHFRLARHAPSDELAFFVERYWTVRWDLRGREPYRSETLPQPCVNLVFEPGCAAVYGISTRAFHKMLEGAGQAFAVKFRPGAFYPFVGFPMVELTDRSRPVREVFGEESDALARDVLALDDDAAQIALVESFLRPRLPARDGNVDAVVRVVQLALECPEILRVEHLAARSGLSERTLQRLFRKYVGVTPKWVIRRLRLHEAADRAAEGTPVDWAAVAYELGYCDQAHFSKDFKAQVGRSPSEYAAQCAAYAARGREALRRSG